MRTIILSILLAFSAFHVRAQNAIMRLPPFERAVRIIKYYEGWHDIRKNYPYIG